MFFFCLHVHLRQCACIKHHLSLNFLQLLQNKFVLQAEREREKNTLLNLFLLMSGDLLLANDQQQFTNLR